MADDRMHLEPGRKPSQPKASAPRVRLSCEMCRQRKIKCDKLSPCTNCQRFGTICIPVERARLPRGRTGRPVLERAPDSDGELRDRVARIEQLLGDLAQSNSNAAAEHPPPAAGAHTMPGQVSDAPPQFNHPGVGTSQGNFNAPVSMTTGETDSFGNPYWQDQLDQTRDLRSTAQNDIKGNSNASSQISGYDMFLAGMAGQGNVSPPERFENESFTPSQAQRQLCHVFLDRVDPVFKVNHRPTLCEFLLHGRPYLDYEPGHPAPAALACAVYYLAACCLSEQQCSEMFRMRKETMVSIHQKETDAALQRADFITSNDLTVLQAFVLSLLASRTHDLTRRVWTMLGIAIRIAQALSLHVPDPPFPVRPFEHEMRRRLWHVIGGLDALLSLDHGSEPLMRTSWLQSHMPTNVNDAEISLHMEGPVHESEGFTDMTFSLISMKSLSGLRSLNFSDFLEPTPHSLNLRQQVVVEFQQEASHLLKGCQPDKSAFHWFTKKTAEALYTMMTLITVRPLQRCPDFNPPRVRGDGILKVAVDALEKVQELQTDPRATPWRMSDWSSSIWHSIAIAVAELCVCEDPSLMERYWPFVEATYQRFYNIPDSRRGAVFNAMEKFMAQGRAHRDKLLGPNIPAANMSGKDTWSLPNMGLPGPQASAFGRVNPPQPQPASTSFMPMVSQSGMVMTMPEQTNMIGPWPNVWDTMEFANPGLDNVRNTSWLNYEGFIEDLYDNVGAMMTGNK